MRVSIDVRLKPGVTLAYASIVHVIGQVRHDEGDGRESGKIARKSQHILFDRIAFRERFPRIMSGGAAAFDITDEAASICGEDGSERRVRFLESEIVRLAGVRDCSVTKE